MSASMADSTSPAGTARAQQETPRLEAELDNTFRAVAFKVGFD